MTRGPFTRNRAMKSPLWKLTNEELEKKLAEVSRGTSIHRVWSNGRANPPVESWMRTKKDVKEEKTIKFIKWLRHDDQVLDKLEKKGVQVQGRRYTQDRRYNHLLVEKKQEEAKIHHANACLSDYRLHKTKRDWQNFNKIVGEARKKIEEIDSKLNPK